MKLTKLLFALSDLFASIGFVFAAFCALGFRFALPVYARNAHLAIGLAEIVLLVLACIVTAAGFALILRRRPVGLLPALCPAIAYLIQGQLLAALVFSSALLLVAGVPFWLALADTRQGTPEGSEGPRYPPRVA